MVHYLANTKKELEKELLSRSGGEQSEYEVHLQKLEKQIREHIRIEQQLKLYAESLQAKVDELERVRTTESSQDKELELGEKASKIQKKNNLEETVCVMRERIKNL